MTRILVVEDEESFSDPLSYLLRKEGYEVAVAATGTAALEDFDRSGSTSCSPASPAPTCAASCAPRATSP